MLELNLSVWSGHGYGEETVCGRRVDDKVDDDEGGAGTEDDDDDDEDEGSRRDDVGGGRRLAPAPALWPSDGVRPGK